MSTEHVVLHLRAGPYQRPLGKTLSIACNTETVPLRTTPDAALDQAAQKCSNGFPGIEKSGACCVSDCGTCGGSGCSSRVSGLTGDHCCTSNILKKGAPCSTTGHAPCFLDGKSWPHGRSSELLLAASVPIECSTQISIPYSN